MKTILLFGVWQLYALAALAIAGAIWYVNKNKALEALTCSGLSILALWLMSMMQDTLENM